MFGRRWVNLTPYRRLTALELKREGKQPAPSGRHVYSIETKKRPQLRRSDMETEHAAPMGLMALFMSITINISLLTGLCAAAFSRLMRIMAR